MVDLQSSMDGIGSAVKGALKTAEPALFATGFVLGITEADATAGVFAADTTLSAQVEHRLAVSLGHLGINNVQIGTFNSGTGNSIKIKPLGWLNKYLGLAVGAYIYREAKLPYRTELYDLLYPLGVGGSIGGVFDPVPATQNSGASVMAAYNNAVQAPQPITRGQSGYAQTFSSQSGMGSLSSNGMGASDSREETYSFMPTYEPAATAL